jgi:hypothetical protein
MSGEADFTVKAEPDDFKNTLFLAMELSRATWLVATFAPRLGEKIGVHSIPSRRAMNGLVHCGKSTHRNATMKPVADLPIAA